MGSEDWYRCTVWNAKIADRFEAKLKRARRKAQYLRIQACTLAQPEPRVALQLLDRYFELNDSFDHAQAYVDQATAFSNLGQIEDAVQAYEQALRREVEFPNVQTLACIELPFLIATTPIAERFEQARSLLDEFRDRPVFPLDVFRWNVAYALILEALRGAGSASAYAQAAQEAASLDKSGFRYHQSLGLVGGQYPELVRELGRIASAT